MMNDMEIEQYFKQHKLLPEAREYITEIRTSDPSRLIGVGAKSNVVTWFLSEKMGHQVQCESRTVEYAFALECEFSDHTLEYWDQLPPIPIPRTNTKGKKYRGSHIPDFLVLTQHGPLIVETKPGSVLGRNLIRYPKDWFMQDGKYLFQPAVEYFQRIGLTYQIRSLEEFNSLRTANLRILLAARESPLRVDPEFKKKILQLLKDHFWMRLYDLGKALGIQDYTPVLKLIDKKILFVDLDNEPLSDDKSVWIVASPVLLDVSKAIRRKGCLDTEEASNDPISFTYPTREKEALLALDRLARVNSGEQSRSIRRWKKQLEEGRRQNLSDFQALLSKRGNSGNRLARLGKKCLEYLNSFIEKEYACAKNMTRYAAWKQYYATAKTAHPTHPPAAYRTFRRYIKKKKQTDIAWGRGGRRAANAVAEPTSVELREIRATLPFELATVDHYNADVFCIIVSPKDVVYVARPWISAMIDIYSGAILAFWISFQHPSRRACAMLIRQCVRRYGRLPRAIISDKGVEFQSVYYQSLLAHLRMDLLLRPAGHPRFGSEVERFFGLLKTQCLSLQPGNLANHKVIRSVSGEFRPEENAILSLSDLVNEVMKFANWRNNTLSGYGTATPASIIESGLSKYDCIGRKQIEDQKFIIATAIETQEYKIDPVRGIHCGPGHYWHAVLAEHAIKKKDIEVHEEPENPYQIYAAVGGDWFVCKMSKAALFERRDPVERLSEAILVNDCKKVIDDAKWESEQDFIRELVNRGDALSAKKVFILDQGESSMPSEKEEDVFLQLNKVSSESLKVTEWGIK